MTLKRALALCESGKYLVLEVHAGGERIFEAEEKELYGAVSGENLYKTLSEIFIKAEKAKKEAFIAAKTQKTREMQAENVAKKREAWYTC